MGIGLGVILVLAGLVLVLNVVDYDIPRVDDYQLGWLLIIVGGAALALTLILWAMRSRSRNVEVDHYDRSDVR